MKKVIIFLAMGLQACIEKPESSKDVQPKCETVELIFYGDLTKSFYNKYSTPFPYMFKSLCDEIAGTYTLDFRYGLITDSNTPLIRYYIPHQAQDPNAANPWLQNEGEASQTSGSSDWTTFSETVTEQLAKKATEKSDCASAINHAIISFQEYDSTARKILLLCTDLEDSYTTIPHIPNDVEVYTVGLLPSVPVEKTLNTKKVKRFESLESALTAITKSIK